MTTGALDTDRQHEHVLWEELFHGCPRPTLTHESADGLLSVIDKAERTRPKVLVLASRADGWCYGGDVTAFAAATDRQGYIDVLATKLHHAVNALRALDSIVVTLVDGVAAGAGVALAAAGDIVIASTRTRFTLGYTKLGLTPDGGTSLLSATIGVHRLLYAALVNPVLDAAAARSLGLVAETVPAEDLLARGKQLSTDLAAGSALALAATKHLIRNQALPNAATALEHEQATLSAAAAGEDSAEGVAAFVAKRSPRFGT